MWMGGLRGPEGEGGEGWKHRCRNWATCQFDVCQAGDLCHSGRVGPLFRGAQLQREELISPLKSCHSWDHQEENSVLGKRKQWHPRLDDVGQGQNSTKKT